MTRALAALVLFAALPSQAITDRSGPYELQVLIGGAPARTYRHGGQTYVPGHLRDDLEGRQSGSPAPRAEENAPAVTPPGSPSAPLPQKAPERPGLGTEFGEAVSSQVTEVPFERALLRPEAVIGARYDDRAGLVALGIEVDGGALTEAELRRSAEPFPVVERGYAAPPPGWRR